MHRHQGEVIKLAGPGLIALFEPSPAPLQAALELQHTLSRQALPLRIAMAVGPLHLLELSPRLKEYLGLTLDLTARLCDRARGNAILLEESMWHAAQTWLVQHGAEWFSGARLNHCLQSLPPTLLPGSPHPVSLMALVWRENADYLTSHPLDGPVPIQPLLPVPETSSVPSEKNRYFGKVSAFKKERGFGFIEYSGNDSDYNEIYVHMTFVVNQTPLHEHDQVYFAIKPGKGGRPQACSVLVMGSRLQGRITNLHADGSGDITIRDHDGQAISLHFTSHENRECRFTLDEVVEFTVNSGSDEEGLTATFLRPFIGDQQSVGPGDNLIIGSLERATVTVFFPEKGYGFAKCRRNNVYLHISEMDQLEPLPQPGDEVQFQVSPGRDGTYRANNIVLLSHREEIITLSSD
ncbi:MAG: cold shock domain-containing protein [Alphaproteobacteria bacterium]